jgi:hypothetical protein
MATATHVLGETRYRDCGHIVGTNTHVRTMYIHVDIIVGAGNARPKTPKRVAISKTGKRMQRIRIMLCVLKVRR